MEPKEVGSDGDEAYCYTSGTRRESKPNRQDRRRRRVLPPREGYDGGTAQRAPLKIHWTPQ